MFWTGIITLNTIAYVCTTTAPTHVFVNRVGPCYEKSATSVTVSEMRITRQTYQTIVSGSFNVTEDISNGWNIKAIMQKCQDIRNLETCDYFRSFYMIKDGCSEVGTEEEDEDLYNMFVHYVRPRLRCPVTAGQYSVTEYPFYTEDNYLTVSEAKISTSMFGYTFTLEGYQGDTKILCVEAHLPLLYIRRPNWKHNKSEIENLVSPLQHSDVTTQYRTELVSPDVTAENDAKDPGDQYQ